MKIKTVTLHNWRSIKHLTIHFQDLMIFIGQNNHGKSNILYGLMFFFGQVPFEALDFNESSNELFVELTFEGLDEFDRTTFHKYVTASNTMCVRKSAIKGTGFEYHGHVEVPNEDWLREENIGNYTRRDIAEALPLARYLPETGRITKEAFMMAQEKYIEEHKDELNFTYQLELGPFLGAKNVAKGIFGDVYFVPSVKNASEDFSTRGNTVFSGLYSRIMSKISDANPEFQEAKKTIMVLMRMLNKADEEGNPNTQRPPELTAFEESLQQELDNWNSTIDVEVIPPNIDDILRVGTSVWVNDGIRTDISRKGQGLQRALIFALVRTLAKTLREEGQVQADSDQVESKDQRSSARQASRSTYFVIEEPELYLHPQAQRELYDSLVELSKSENQIIVCTHSSSFLNLEDYKSICIIRKNSLEEGTTAFQCTEELLDEVDDKTYFNLTRWINPVRSELFFARKVILVEGPTDKTIIPYLAHEIGVFRHDYSVIECGSKSSMPSYLHLLNRFSIRYVVVYDQDHQTYKNPNAIASADKDTTKILSLIDESLGSSIILINDIEEEIGITEPPDKSKPFLALSHVKGTDFNLTQQLEQKLRLMYQ